MLRMKNYVDFIATPPRAFCQTLKGLKANEVSRCDLVHADHRLLRKSFARWRRQFSRLSERSKEKFSTSNRDKAILGTILDSLVTVLARRAGSHATTFTIGSGR